MQLDFGPIISTNRYLIDKEKLKTTGKQRALKIWLYIFLFITVVAWPYLIYKAIRYAKKSKIGSAERVAYIADFARSNGFTATNSEAWKPIPDDLISTNVDLPFKTEKIVHFNMLRGKLLGYDFAYSLASIFVLQRGGEASQWPSIIFTVELPVTLPRMFINSKSNNLPGLDAEAINFELSQDHVLEGDFPKYYDVRIEKDQHIDMYTTLTPEVMDTLKSNDQYDVFLNGKQLIFITFGDQARYFAGIPTVFTNAEMLMREIDKIARAIRSQA
ncbi:MAG: hypothetical protein KIH63_005685 [Candidatus Saccharibacteria bacterium]|nr:hypothetical protein [Candidatus Saccharibacteria bacterium]